MQNTVIELSKRLHKSIDSNYNVIDMQAVLDIVSTLECISITKELLETTRLGKYINELRRRTTNESLAKRAKELVRKWRNTVLPEANGSTANNSAPVTNVNNNFHNPAGDRTDSPDVKLIKSRKRPLNSDNSSDARKRQKLNGQRNNEQIYLSDNSNSSVQELIRNRTKLLPSSEIIVVNSDSNSSCHADSSDRIPKLTDTNLTFSGRNLGGKNAFVANESIAMSLPAPPVEKSEPKKRGRKKGSKNHKTLLVQAEESFTNKMAVSVNSKVKTTQELLASIQNKNLKTAVTSFDNKTSSPKLPNNRASTSKQNSTNRSYNDISRNDYKQKNEIRTETIIIDNENSRNSFFNELVTSPETSRSEFTTMKNFNEISRNEEVTRIRRESENDSNDLIEVVGEISEPAESVKTELPTESATSDAIQVKSTREETAEDILAKLPKIDRSALLEQEEDDAPICTCAVSEPVAKNENITVEIHGTPEVSIFDVPTDIVEKTTNSSSSAAVPCEVVTEIDPDCPAGIYYKNKFRLNGICDRRVDELHTRFLDSINGNKCERLSDSYSDTSLRNDGLFANIVPNFHNGERIKKDLKLESLNYLENKLSLQKSINSCTISNCSDRTADGDTCDETHKRYARSENGCDEYISRGGDFRDISDKNTLGCTLTSSCRVEDSDSGSDSLETIQKDRNRRNKNDEQNCDEDSDKNTTPEKDADLSADCFREFNEVVSSRSYNNELLHILPYVVLD